MKSSDTKKKERRHESPLSGPICTTSSWSNNTQRKKSGSDRPVSKKSHKRARKEEQENLEEERLTTLLFGAGDVNEKIVSTNSDDNNGIENEIKQDFTFEIDRDGKQSIENDEDSSEIEEHDHAWRDEEDDNGEQSIIMEEDDNEDGVKEDVAPVWEDPDDAATKLIHASSRLRKLRSSRQETEALSSQDLERRLRQRYETFFQARTDWAAGSKEKEEGGNWYKRKNEEDNDSEKAAMALFSTSKSLLETSRNQLPPNILNIVRCPDANLADPNKAVVRCIDFHPGSDPDQPLMLTAGLDKTLRFFQIGEEKCEKIHGIHCKLLF